MNRLLHDKHAFRVREEYDRLASDYDVRWPHYNRATQTETLRRLPELNDKIVLDVGCETGGLLGGMNGALSGTRFCGIELSMGMLEQARTRLSRSVRLTVGSAEDLPFPSSSFDLIVSASVFHFWLDPLACLKEVRRVLKDNGGIFITDWCDDFLACRFCDWYLRWFNRAHVKTYTLRECKHLLERTGFAAIEGERYKISWLWGLMTVHGIKQERCWNSTDADYDSAPQ